MRTRTVNTPLNLKMTALYHLSKDYSIGELRARIKEHRDFFLYRHPLMNVCDGVQFVYDFSKMKYVSIQTFADGTTKRLPEEYTIPEMTVSVENAYVENRFSGVLFID